MKGATLLAVTILSLLHCTVARPQSNAAPIEDEERCGYKKCTRSVPGKLNVHIIPHTHDDVGWLKTVDQYYFGHRTNIQRAGVQYILDTVVQELLRDPEKRFVYVESAFFSKWWKRQTPALQRAVKQLVNEGRLEFIGGAWSMNDEAGVHYNSVIDHFAWGLKFLNDTFGPCGRPKVGWQIDPFGHSREQASIFAQMGYDGMFMVRLDYQDKSTRMQNKEAEMIWHASENLDPDHSDLFTSILYNHYSPPPGFCFDVLCQDEPIIDDEESADYNVPRRMQTLYEWLVRMSDSYRSNNLLITMGDDFHFQVASMWYSNLDKLIKHINELYGDRVNMFYSTPTCYLKAVHESNLTWPEKSDDFFPYASDPNTYWTGYFTSRPNQKRYERMGNHFLQVCKQLTALAPNQQPFFEKNLAHLREMMGVWQHHDAITGTEKQHVSDDYAMLMHKAMKGCEENVRAALLDIHGTRLEFSNCLYMNMSQCAVTESDSPVQVATLYNPTAQTRRQKVRIPLKLEIYKVFDENRVEVDYQIVPIPDSVLNITERESSAKFELVFVTKDIPPFGVQSYLLMIDPRGESPPVSNWARAEDFTIENEHLTLTFRDGKLTDVESEGFKDTLDQHFAWYEGFRGSNNPSDQRSSGAYIFRPKGTERILSPTVTEVVRGPIVDEVHQVYNDWISQVIRLYKGDRHIEFEWLVAGIPVDDDIGKEVVNRFVTTIKSDETFYTDSNGREMIKRIRNYRPTWNVTIVEPQSGNYYPVTAKIAIEDENTRLAVLNDRAQGGSSLQDGVVELMIHRRLLNDDAFGVGEALNEDITARGTHYVFFGRKTSEHPTLEAYERLLQSKVLVSPWVLFASASSAPSLINHKTSSLRCCSTLPINIRLLTLEPWGTKEDPRLLVRFEHFFEKHDDPELSKPVTIDLEEFFEDILIEFRETTLDGNQWLDETTRFKFVPDEVDPETPVEAQPYIEFDEGTQITLTPMQIRTFIVKIREESNRYDFDGVYHKYNSAVRAVYPYALRT